MRTMIVLTDNQHALAKRRAAQQGISLSEYIRRLVDRDLEEDAPEWDPSVIFGLIDDGGSNIRDNKHQMIGEAIDKYYADKGL